MFVVRLIVATRSSSGKIIKEMLGSVASGTHCIISGCDYVCAYVKCYLLHADIIFHISTLSKMPLHRLTVDGKLFKYCLLFICVAAGMCTYNSIRM